jgi:transcriptional regulator with XRE-family HTH domain
MLIMSNTLKKLGDRIREIRESRKLTQEELAYQADLDYSYVNQIENGRKNPTVQILDQIAKVLKVTIKDLFSF